MHLNYIMSYIASLQGETELDPRRGWLLVNIGEGLEYMAGNTQWESDPSSICCQMG